MSSDEHPSGASQGTDDPADRVTLDDRVQLALAVVLDRLTPAERTSFVLHDVFGFPFDAVAAIVGRTPAAVRQLASRARRSIRRDAEPDLFVAASSPEHDLVVERFIAACEGGDIGELVAVLDPDIDGHAELIGFGTLADAEGRPYVAHRLIGLFGPESETVLVPVALEAETAIVAYARGRLAALVRVEHDECVIRHLRAWVLPPAARPHH
jgi:RNA polymerase sigma-70 factor (ECF subfamily)